MAADRGLDEVEAAHQSLFVAGWRPFIGWVCGLAMVFNFLIIPAVSWFGVTAEPMDFAVMSPILLGMLGLSGLRTTEKIKKVSREQ